MLYGAAAAITVLLITAFMTAARASANKRRGRAAFVVVPSGSDRRQLERRVKAFCAEQLFCDPAYRCGIIILLTDERLSEQAHKLCEKLDGVSVVCRQELCGQIYSEWENSDSQKL